MGREIRMVPENWEHPRFEEDDFENYPRRGQYHPMSNLIFNDVFSEWIEEFDRIRNVEMSEIEKKCYPNGLADWLVDEGAPKDPAYYRNYTDDEAKWFQMYETVSEGTPVSPPFATKEELVNYLVENGDFWDQKRGHGGWERKAAEEFVQVGWAPTFTLRVKKEEVTE